MDEIDCTALRQLLRSRVKGMHAHLQVVHAGVVVAAAALQFQNAERDIEVARVLRHCVGDRLFDQIERAAELIAYLQTHPAHPTDIDLRDAEEPDPE
jgi:hypothetical protein